MCAVNESYTTQIHFIFYSYSHHQSRILEVDAENDGNRLPFELEIMQLQLHRHRESSIIFADSCFCLSSSVMRLSTTLSSSLDGSLLLFKT
mmetsp:Transcript_16996/g.39230  ORF Transcript_16996/g.39230 Transcript_16996/m.39230 type:complete len:91 (+) Transcript_16996:486-758(+)